MPDRHASVRGPAHPTGSHLAPSGSSAIRPAIRVFVAALGLVLAAAIPQAAPVAAAGDEVKQISAGARHVCAVKTNGTVWCWGFNKQGQLGDGTTTTRRRPVRVNLHMGSTRTALNNVVQVAAGGNFTCARRTDHTVWCWGANGQGQLGTGSVGGLTGVLRQVKLGNPAFTAVTDLSAGGAHACAATTQATGIPRIVRCWGKGTSGQLGHEKYQSSPTPRNLYHTRGPLSLGPDHSCAAPQPSSITVEQDRVHCWGHNGSGRLGVNDTAKRSVPSNVLRKNVGTGGISELTGVKRVAAGRAHTCAVFHNGRISCWGENASGQLGNGNRKVRKLASDKGTEWRQTVKNVKDAKQVAAGYDHSCAIRKNNIVWCWGSNSHLQLARKASVKDKKTRVKVNGLTGVQQLALNGSKAGGSFSCARKSDRTVWCWGSNKNGQLGNGSSTNNKSPIRVRF
ncbi:MAG: hypothetical protein KF809_03690 [Chloroflexi bacterium]|nr:hypothetical protein [Chloroflexota bacterium]